MKTPFLIKDVVRDVFEVIDSGAKDALNREDIFEIWKKAAGSRAAKHTKPTNIRKGVLIVNVDSSVWIYQLRLKKEKILQKLNGHFNKDMIKDIRLRVGEL
ncbi:MAG TPA: DUF721 domain-containing protein [Candidatus Omnitrophica bacterium]|nr:DUF721 domain-containing protein [Candidatus Omnitrophota bacterium]